MILKSEYFQKFKDRYVNVDSIVKNGKKIDVALKSSENFTFSQINLDSLEKGNYQLFGKVFSFSPVTDYKIEENFDFQFTKD